MRAVAAAIAGLAVASGTGAQTGSAPQSRLSAREMYVSCYLLVRREPVARGADGSRPPYAPENCSMMSLAAIRDRESAAAPKPHFCLTMTAEVEKSPPDAMAYAFLDFFERRGSTLAGLDGRAAYVAAMISKWPCPAE